LRWLRKSSDERKGFFFEKRRSPPCAKQKISARAVADLHPKKQKFFGSFFQKRTFFLFLQVRMMQKSVIHIGPHKTGSSYLQVCFARYRDALRLRGIIVPEVWEEHGNRSHTALVSALREGGDFAGAAEVVARASMEGTTLLISAEDLSDLTVDELLRLKALLGDGETVIVYYIRRSSDLLYSSWQEDVKQGLTRTFPEYYGLHVRKPEESPAFNIETRLLPFVEVFGKSAIRLVAYSHLRDTGADLFIHFARHFLGWEQVEPPPEREELNVAGGPAEIELLRTVNVIETLRNPQNPRNLRLKFDEMRSELDAATILAAMEANRKILGMDDAFPMILGFHRELRERYTENVVPPCPAQFFFRPMYKEITYIGRDYMLRPGVVEALHALHGQLAQADG
jgi:hypothetical protein